MYKIIIGHYNATSELGTTSKEAAIKYASDEWDNGKNIYCLGAMVLENDKPIWRNGSELK